MALSALFTPFLPLIIAVLIITMVWLIQRATFKELSLRFESTESLPFSIRPRTLKYGTTRMRNVTRVAEQGENLFIKIWCAPLLKIPYGAFSEIQLIAGTSKRPFVLFTFKEPGLKPLGLQFKKDQLQQFPILLKRAAK